MNSVFKWIWFSVMIVVGFLDCLTTYWAEMAGGEEFNLSMNWLIEFFGPGIAIFVFGLPFKIIFIIALFLFLNYLFEMADSIPERPARVFAQYSIYAGMIIFAWVHIPFIVGNYLISS
jgi:hypothetical protein